MISSVVPYRLVLWAAGVFVLGFLLFHGREAQHSGSWNYILTHDDDYAYLAIAEGYTQDPPSDANPFYHEERGRTNSPLDYATVAMVGSLAVALDVPVPWTIPAWKIFMPLLLWYTLTWCLVRFWQMEGHRAAMLSMLLLVTTTLFHGSNQFTLLRFPHPGDGMWLAFIWVTLVLRVDDVGRRYPLVVTLIAIVTLIVAPFYVILGGWILLFATVWSVVVGRRGNAWRHIIPLLTVGALCLGRLFQVVIAAGSSRYLQHALNLEIAPSRVVDVSSILLLGLVLLAVGVAAEWRRESMTTMDAALIGILSLEPIAANAQFVLGNDHQISLHRYYLLVIEFACIIGWLAEKLPAALRRIRGTPGDWLLPACLAVAEVVVLAHPDLNWFRYLPRTDPTHFMTDNDTLILGVLPGLILLVWLPLRRPDVVGWVRGPVRGLAVVSVVALLLYGIQPSQLREKNENIPFSGAFEWLDLNAKPGSVVLTMPVKWTIVDYSVFYAPVKSYTNVFGSHVSDQPEATKFRQSYYVLLLEGRLPTSSYRHLKGARDLTSHLRLDYFLVERNGPFYDLVIEQLGDIVRVVYSDERCLLLRVSE